MNKIETYVKENINQNTLNTAMEAIVTGNAIPFDIAAEISQVIENAYVIQSIPHDTEVSIEDIVRAIY